MAHTDRPQAVRTLAPQAAPPGIYASKFDWDVAARIVERVAAGESLRSLCRSDPAMPTEKTVWNWRRARPEFDELMDVANRVARARSLAVQARRDEAKRAAKAEARRARGFKPIPPWPDGYSQTMVDAICDRLVMAESLQSICRDPAMPSVGTVYNWLRRYPEFVKQYRLAKSLSRDVLVDQAVHRASATGGLRAARKVLKACERRIGHLAPTRYG
ncbi:hypothetical protein ACO2Q0_10645 [Phenylobacterium sp. VNQ135]|uniref:terminase small subunit-like protein n=1 Tax=Phenylobacterium sp. VNQ135 TaxID=3400922 RepID=UPI003C0C9386